VTQLEEFAPLRYPIVFELPDRLTDVESWHGHLPFAFFAVAALRPATIVELGTWKGDSYCAFCQAVASLELPSRCHAVDTWEGDDHTGPYGPEVLEELRRYHDPLYGPFSELRQETFDAAAAAFGDGSIDLLHIDGCHRYEDVAHDLETWLPKLGASGVVLLHDTHVREPEFGVWRLWEELSPHYPSFAFSHGHGLGVLATGAAVDAGFLAFLEAARRGPATASFFAALGSRIAVPAQLGLILAATEQRLATREAELGTVSGELATASGELATVSGELATVNAELATASTELASVSAELARAGLAAESLGLERDDAKAAAERHRDERERAEARAEKLQHERERAEAQVRAREHDLTDILRSPSWRVTAPLRSAKRELHRARYLSERARRRRSGTSLSRAVEHPVPLTVAELTYRPLVSVVTPVYNTAPQWLEAAVESVRAQSYPHWQLCLADDGSTNEATIVYLRSLEGDPSITVSHGENGGIAAATNRALAAAEGEFVAFLDHDDELDPDALLECVRRLNEKPGTDIVYTDEDKVDRRGRRSDPFFKPDCSPELFRGVMYVGHLLCARRSLVEEAGGADSAFDGVQDYELMLRLSERTSRIEHVPRILYHWRKLPGSIAAATDAKDGIPQLQAEAVTAHLERTGVAAVAGPHPTLPHRTILLPGPRPRWPGVTVVVPTRDAPSRLARCLASLFSRTTYPSFTVLLVDNGTTDPDALRSFEDYPVEVLPFDEPFNFSRANNLGVAAARGEYVVLLNNDTEIRTPEWLEVLVSLAEADGVGAVGPLLVYPDGSVQHAGVVLGIRGTADHIMRGFPATADGYAGSLSCTREVSAVTGACLAIGRGLYEDAGGLDERFATHYQDVDLCLRLRRLGRRNLYTPRAVVRHDEGATRGDHYDRLDRALLLDAWGETIARGDPYYSRWLSLEGADYRPVAA
jgi:O-antigen biosynthesis protein